MTPKHGGREGPIRLTTAPLVTLMLALVMACGGGGGGSQSPSVPSVVGPDRSASGAVAAIDEFATDIGGFSPFSATYDTPGEAEVGICIVGPLARLPHEGIIPFSLRIASQFNLPAADSTIISCQDGGTETISSCGAACTLFADNRCAFPLDLCNGDEGESVTNGSVRITALSSGGSRVDYSSYSSSSVDKTTGQTVEEFSIPEGSTSFVYTSSTQCTIHPAPKTFCEFTEVEAADFSVSGTFSTLKNFSRVSSGGPETFYLNHTYEVDQDGTFGRTFSSSRGAIISSTVTITTGTVQDVDNLNPPNSFTGSLSKSHYRNIVLPILE
jgi:hypothetical protein